MTSGSGEHPQRRRKSENKVNGYFQPDDKEV